MRLLLILFITPFMFLYAEVVDAIAIDVNGEPITIAEIKAVEKKFNISKKMAIELLIQDRLEKSVIDKADIQVSDEEADAKIAQIASSKGISLDMLKSALIKRGIDYNEYREEIKKSIKKEKFFIKNIAPLIQKPTLEELKLYYQTHKKEFENNTPISQTSVIAYYSNSFSKIKKAIENPMIVIEGLTRKNQLISSGDVPPRVFKIIQQTPQGSFTPPINTGRGFVAYFIKSKSTQTKDLPFDMVKNQVEMRWLQEQRKKAMENFINKLRNSAEIRIIRIL